MFRFVVFLLAVVVLGSCAGRESLFLGEAVGKPLPTDGMRVPIADLLPSEVYFVCKFGPYTSEFPASAPEQFRQSISDLEIFPTAEHQGYFVYLGEDGSVIAADQIRHSVNGYSPSERRGDGFFVCDVVDKIHVGLRVEGWHKILYLGSF